MKIYECINKIDPHEPRAVAVGLFDGLHLGHCAVILRMLAAGEERGLAPTVLTFDFVKSPDGRLLSPDAFEARLREMGVNTLIRLPFDTVRNLSPEQFARDILAGVLCTKAIFCGEDFRFGKNAAAGARELSALGDALGFTAEALPLVEHEGEPISSTRIRSCIRRGENSAANTMLGRKL